MRAAELGEGKEEVWNGVAIKISERRGGLIKKALGFKVVNKNELIFFPAWFKDVVNWIKKRNKGKRRIPLKAFWQTNFRRNNLSFNGI